MHRIDRLFSEKKEDVLNIFVTAGYPGLHDLVPLVKTLAASGVDMVEVGMPYSDPLADGPTIQASSTRALQNGMTLDLLFAQLRELRPQVDLPIVLMGYFNQVMQYGEERFVAACREAGVDGLILPDLPLIEYENRYRALFAEAGLKVSLLICPTTEADRIRRIDALTTGFIYMVADAATTGSSAGISSRQLAYFERIRSLALQHPRLIGFGISDADSFRTAASYAHGAIIGSAFLRAIADREGEELLRAAADFVRSVREPQVV